MAGSDGFPRRPIWPRLLRAAPRAPVLLVSVVLLEMALLGGGAMLKESTAIDEVPHIGAGLSYWQRRDLRMNMEHPPLAKLLAAVPLLFLRIHPNYASTAWEKGHEQVFGEMVLTQSGVPATVILLWARLPMLLLTLAMGCAVGHIGHRIGGRWGAPLAVTSFATMPVFLAFGPLVLTDLALSLFSLLALWALGELRSEPSFQKMAVLSASLAAAFLSKFSSGLLLFVLAIFIAFAGTRMFGARANAWEPATRRRARLLTIISIFLAGIAVYGTYLIFSWNQSAPLQTLGDSTLEVILRRLLAPIVFYVWGIRSVIAGASRPVFLLGHHYSQGVWFYFPTLFFLKSPAAFLGLLALTGGLFAATSRGRRAAVIPRRYRAHVAALAVGFSVFTIACLAAKLNIGLRHFGVPIAILALVPAFIPRLIRLHSPRGRLASLALSAGLTVGCLVTAAANYPNYVSYFNLLALGRPSYWLANDSNVDFDAALPTVESFARQRSITRLPMDYYGLAHPQTFVPEAILWNCQFAPPPGTAWVAVSANFIMDRHNCTWLLRYPQFKLAGGSMYAFNLPLHLPAAGTMGGPPTSGFLHMRATDPHAREKFLINFEAESH